MLFYQHRMITNPAEGASGGTGYPTVAAGTKLAYAPPKPIRVVRWGFICTTTVNDGTNALKLTCDLRAVAGGSTVTGTSTVIAAQSGWNAPNLPPVLYDLNGGSLTLVAGTSQVAAGAVVYHEVASQKPSATFSPYYPDPQTAFDAPGGVNAEFAVYPGQEVLITSQATAPAAGAGIFFLEVEELAFTGSGNNYPRIGTGVPSGITPTPSDPGTLTRVLS